MWRLAQLRATNDKLKQLMWHANPRLPWLYNETIAGNLTARFKANESSILNNDSVVFTSKNIDDKRFSAVQCSPIVGKLHCDYTDNYTDYTLNGRQVESPLSSGLYGCRPIWPFLVDFSGQTL